MRSFFCTIVLLYHSPRHAHIQGFCVIWFQFAKPEEGASKLFMYSLLHLLASSDLLKLSTGNFLPPQLCHNCFFALLVLLLG